MCFSTIQSISDNVNEISLSLTSVTETFVVTLQSTLKKWKKGIDAVQFCQPTLQSREMQATADSSDEHIISYIPWTQDQAEYAANSCDQENISQTLHQKKNFSLLINLTISNDKLTTVHIKEEISCISTEYKRL